MSRQALAIVVKELRLFFSDPRGVLVAIVTPIAIASFFGFLFAGNRQDTQAKIPLLVADADGSPLSKGVVAGLAADPLLDVKPAEAAAAREAVRRGKAAAAVLLPKGFSDGAVRAFMGGGTPPEVGLLVDPSRATEGGLVRGLLAEKVFQLVSREAFGGEAGMRFLDESLSRLDAQESLPPEQAPLRDLLRDFRRFRAAQPTPAPGAAGAKNVARGGPGSSPPFTLREEAVTARTGLVYNSYAHSFAGMGVQFLLFTAIELGIAFLLERQGGLWKRLRGAPLSKGTLLLGKTLAGAAIGLVSIGATFAFGMAFLGIRTQGTFVGFLLLLLASALMASAFGLLLASLGRTTGATRGLSILAVLLLVMLGGGWVPAFVFPAWLQKATLVLPTRWAIDGFDAVTWRGIGLAGALTPLAVVLGWAVLFLGVAVARFRWNDG